MSLRSDLFAFGERLADRGAEVVDGADASELFIGQAKRELLFQEAHQFEHGHRVHTEFADHGLAIDVVELEVADLESGLLEQRNDVYGLSCGHSYFSLGKDLLKV